MIKLRSPFGVYLNGLDRLVDGQIGSFQVSREFVNKRLDLYNDKIHFNETSEEKKKEKLKCNTLPRPILLWFSFGIL